MTNSEDRAARRWIRPSGHVETGGGGWGNNELETYTSRTANAELQDGALVIRVLKEPLTGSDNITRNYTSARLVTRNKFTQTYGRFEARLKVPYGQGIWPAFWMLGNDLDSAGWPKCGEIDIMENIGREPATVHGTLHGLGYSGANGVTASYTLPLPGSSPTITIYLPWSGSQTSFGSMSTNGFTRHKRPLTCLPAKHGFLITRSFWFSMWQSAAISRVIPTVRRFFRKS